MLIRLQISPSFIAARVIKTFPSAKALGAGDGMG